MAYRAVCRNMMSIQTYHQPQGNKKDASKQDKEAGSAAAKLKKQAHTAFTLGLRTNIDITVL